MINKLYIVVNRLYTMINNLFIIINHFYDVVSNLYIIINKLFIKKIIFLLIVSKVVMELNKNQKLWYICRKTMGEIVSNGPFLKWPFLKNDQRNRY